MELDVSRKPQGSDDNSSQPPRGAGRNVPNSALQKNRGRAVKVVVSNLHPGVTQTDIAELFETVGPLKNATLSRYPNGSSSCEAEVIFENMPDALEAIKRYNLVPLDNQPLQITLVTTRTGKGRRGGGNQKKAGLRVEENSYNDQPNSPETGNGYNDQPSSPMNDRGNGGAQGGRGGRNPRRRRKRYTERRPANDGGNDRGDRGEGNDRDMYDD